MATPFSVTSWLAVAMFRRVPADEAWLVPARR